MGDKIGWIVCIACIVSNFIRAGIVLSFGTFIAEFRRLYQNPMAELGEIKFHFVQSQKKCRSFNNFKVIYEDSIDCY